MSLNNLNLAKMPPPGYHHLTQSQLNIWFDQLLHPESTSYNIGFYIEFKGHIDLDRARKALQSAIDSLDTMRSEYIVVDEHPYQRFLDKPNIPLPLWDFSNAPNPKSLAHKIIDNDIRQPFDLSNGINARFGLIQIASDEWVWFGTCHHIILDGVGGAILFNRFSEAYKNNGLSDDYYNNQWPEAIIQANNYIDSKLFKKDEEYWKKSLIDLANPHQISPSGELENTKLPFPETITHSISRTDFDVLLEVSKITGISFYALLCGSV